METNLAHENEFLTGDEAARLLRKPNRKVLAVERCLRKDHPPYIKIGRKILYRRADVLAWLEAHVVNPATCRVSKER
jgi:excisionase family DNA binding protein